MDVKRNLASYFYSHFSNGNGSFPCHRLDFEFGVYGYMSNTAGVL